MEIIYRWDTSDGYSMVLTRTDTGDYYLYQPTEDDLGNEFMERADQLNVQNVVQLFGELLTDHFLDEAGTVDDPDS